MILERPSQSIHPLIRKCLKHLDVLGADHHVKQIVYMYMETLCRQMNDVGENNASAEKSVHKTE